ncbi:MAG: peptidoglycan editing factor PgeF [Paracoccus sp. (in: a-proteobacteria)]|nr:peptidoglycan editing factor PgeF [Paracoccus sp. (in: a-proteobacteria)]
MQTTLEILTHPLLAPVRHGFFTRKGGASSGLFSGLNCGRRSSDQRDMVQVNRARVADAMGVDQQMLATVRQVHSSKVVTLDQHADIEEIRETEADALVTDRRDVAIAVLTADCQPILLADPDAGVIGACHAGWRGSLEGVIEATVEAMQRLGARQIRAVIGPSISQRHYEVGEDFMQTFLVEDPAMSRFFSGGPTGKPHFDLPGFGLARLRALDVDAEWSGHCTYADPGRFFSYRRATHENQPDYGRLISAIAL